MCKHALTRTAHRHANPFSLCFLRHARSVFNFCLTQIPPSFQAALCRARASYKSNSRNGSIALVEEPYRHRYQPRGRRHLEKVDDRYRQPRFFFTFRLGRTHQFDLIFLSVDLLAYEICLCDHSRNASWASRFLLGRRCGRFRPDGRAPGPRKLADENASEVDFAEADELVCREETTKSCQPLLQKGWIKTRTSSWSPPYILRR